MVSHIYWTVYVCISNIESLKAYKRNPMYVFCSSCLYLTNMLTQKIGDLNGVTHSHVS